MEADDETPSSTERHEPFDSDRARAVIARRADEPGPLLEILHDLQDAFGYVEPTVIPLVAEALNCSQAEVHGVVTFYRDVRTEPPGRHTIEVCRGEACQSVGADDLLAYATRATGIDVGATSPDGACTLREVYCLGNCALGPAVLADGRLAGRVTPERLDALIVGALGAPRKWGPEEVAPRAEGAEPVTVFVPGDAAACSLGADDVAEAIVAGARGLGRRIRLVRNGSRGLLFLEPLVEVATAHGRVAFGPVTPDDVPGLLDAGLLDAGLPDAGPTANCDHPLALGATEEVPWLKRQTRQAFARVGIVDPRSLEDYEAHGGFVGLRRALGLEPAAIVAEILASGLRGRGGAGFPAGIKWRAALEAPGEEKYVCCNADEGDSGTFADRMLLEGDPFLVIEAMIIAGLAIGARHGVVYLRSEYPKAREVFAGALEIARAAGLTGPSVLGSGPAFDLLLRRGAGSYVCGEETAMLESLEGRRGVVRAKPPLPVHEGLFGRPTVINNVLTLAAVPAILAEGGAAYAQAGVGRSRGTQVFQLGGNVARGGIVETAFGVTLGELVHDFGGGSASGRPVKAVQLGGPLGAYVPPEDFGLEMGYEELARAGAMLGHGGVVVFDEDADLGRMARFAMEFCALESCGKCTPCRIGAVRGVEVLDAILAGRDVTANLELLEDLCATMADASLCAMGGLTPQPVRSIAARFPEELLDTNRGGR